MFENYPDVVTVKELCEMLKIGKNTAYELVHQNKIKSITIKNKIRITKRSIIDYINNEI